MGWQDRDYAKNASYGGARHAPSFSRSTGPRSIVTILIVINVAVHLLRGFSPALDQLLYNWCTMTSRAVLHGQLWRLITAQYMHATGNHILFNMIGLYFFGRQMEIVWGRRKFLVLYTIAGLAGNLFYLLLSASGWFGMFSLDIPLLGASGCILGLLGAVAVLFPRAKILIMFVFPMEVRTAAIIFAAIYALNIWNTGANAGGDAAHLAGMGFGVWWAARGERWWARRGGHTFTKLSGTFSGLKPVRKSTFQRKIDTRKADAQLIDRLLAKVYDGGLHSLSPSERRQLTQATDRQRQAEQNTGRVDRL